MARQSEKRILYSVATDINVITSEERFARIHYLFNFVRSAASAPVVRKCQKYRDKVLAISLFEDEVFALLLVQKDGPVRVSCLKRATYGVPSGCGACCTFAFQPYSPVCASNPPIRPAFS